MCARFDRAASGALTSQAGRRACRYLLDCFEEGSEGGFGQLLCMFHARFLVVGIAFDKDGTHAKVVRKLHIGERVANHDAGGCFNIGKIGARLLKQTSLRLAAVALLLLVWTDVVSIQMRALRSEILIKRRVDAADVVRGVQTEGDTTLVREDDHSQPGPVELADCLRDAGKNVKLAPGGDVAPLRKLLIQNAIAVQKDGAKDGK